MARVNHKLVKQRLNEKRSKITDKQFFSSRMLAGHFEDMAAAQTRRYHYNRRVRVNLYWKPKDSFTAATNNLYIRINSGHPLVSKVKGRENRYWLVVGFFAHELGHVLFTDFLALQTYHNYLDSYRWFPRAPDLKTADEIRNEKAFWDYVKADPMNLQMIHCISAALSNNFEDGYTEDRMLVEFPGTLGYGLEALRDRHQNEMPTVTELIEKEESEGMHIFESIMQIMLSYAKFGYIKYGDEPLSDERVQTVFSLINEIDFALMTRSGKERLGVVNLVMIRCWDYIHDFCEKCKERQKEAEASGSTGSISETLSEVLQSIVGSSATGTGNTTPVPEASSGTQQSTAAAERAKTHSEADSSTSPEESETVPQTDSKNEDNSSESGALPKKSAQDEGDSTGTISGGSISGSEKQETTDCEGGRIPLQQTERLSTPVGGSTTKNNEYHRKQYDRAASDIERILDKMAENAACQELESERIRELNEAAQNISYGNIHNGIHIRVNRIASVDTDLVEQYDAICNPLVTISRQLQKSLIKQLKENRRGGKQTGLIMGRRLDVHSLCRNDGKVFYKNNLPNEIPELAVGLLLDESGSMRSCDRCTYARASAIIMHDFCESLEIPIMIYGHSTGYYDGHEGVELYSYAEFDGFDNDDKYRLMDIGARGSNRDGAALRYVAESLAKRPEAIKLLILVSDGQPADTGYYGTAAEEDLRGVKQEYQRKGIIFVAAAIGNDKQNIERIYGDSFLDITDLNQLPTKLTNVAKRFVRV